MIKSAFPSALDHDVRKKNPPDEHLTENNKNFVTMGQKVQWEI